MTQANTLAIRPYDGIAEFEQYLGYPNLGHQSLALPLHFRVGGSLSRSVGLAQLVFTWAQSSPSPTVRTYIQSPSRDAYQKFVARLHGFAAAYFSDRVTSKSDDDNIRMDLMGSCLPRVTAMSEGNLRDTATGRTVEFILVHGARRQFHHLLYRQTPKRAELLDRQRHGQLVADPRAMRDLLRRCLRQYGRTYTAQRKALASQLNHDDNPFGQVLHESFRNTAEHAYLDDNGVLPPKVMRSVTIAINQIDRDDFNPSTLLSSDHPLSGRYFQERSNESRASCYRNKYIDVLEVSVLDSGPGFARTISGATPKSSTDRDLVAACFSKHKTAKSGPTSGAGLGRILESIHTLRGFVRVRTSTTEAFFAGGPGYTPTMDPLDFIQGDLAEVRGTSIIFGIPIVY